MNRPFALALMAVSSLGLAGQALAQTAPASAATAATAATPEESMTRSLNTEISQRLLAADRKEAADAANYREAVARYEAELARYNAARDLRAESLELRRENIDIEQDLYNQRMADWRATVAACEAGDKLRCESGKAPAQPQPPR